MKKNFTTFMLLLIATILVIGIGVLGGAMYLDLVKPNRKYSSRTANSREKHKCRNPKNKYK